MIIKTLSGDPRISTEDLGCRLENEGALSEELENKHPVLMDDYRERTYPKEKCLRAALINGNKISGSRTTRSKEIECTDKICQECTRSDDREPLSIIKLK